MNEHWSSIDEAVVVKLAMPLGKNWNTRHAAETLEREWSSRSKGQDWPAVANIGLKPWTIFHCGAIVYLACRFEGNRPVYPVKIGVTTSPGERLFGLRTEYQTKADDSGSFGYFGALCVRDEVVAKMLERVLHKLCRAAAVGSFGIRTTKGEWYFANPITIWNKLFDPIGGILDSRIAWAAANDARPLRDLLCRIAPSSFLRSRDFVDQAPLIQDMSEFYWFLQSEGGLPAAVKILGELGKQHLSEGWISTASFANALITVAHSIKSDATDELLETIYWRQFSNAFLQEMLIHWPYGKAGGIDFKSVFNLWGFIGIERILADFLRPETPAS